jgi:hypothetical protein
MLMTTSSSISVKPWGRRVRRGLMAFLSPERDRG